jgi:Right handed beta helix region/Secretion system C-terminal sorting domain
MRLSSLRFSALTQPAWGILLLGNLLAVNPAQAVIMDVFPGGGVLSQAVEQSHPRDTLLVHPGIYPYEVGAPIRHPLTIISVGGATANEIRVCTDLCGGALLAIYNETGPIVIDGLTITREHTFPGGSLGISIIDASNITVRNCTFFDLGTGYSGVMVGSAGTVRVEHNLFFGYTAGVLVQGNGGNGDFFRNTFAASHIEIQDARPNFTANIIAQTSVACVDGLPTFSCNDSWESTYTGLPNPTGSNNNFAADPLFCDPNTRNFHLLPGSPCLPENSPAGCGLVGAFGLCEVLATNDPTEAPSLARLEVYPNPSSGSVVFSLPETYSAGVIAIFDAHGRQVDILRPTVGEITWNPSKDLTRGIYFARVLSGKSGVVKFVLLR